MATLKLRRGLEANIDTAEAAIGEPLFTTDTGKLYIYNGTNKVLINKDYPDVVDGGEF